eukprot:1160990-Pelagomonas_calceolata.AAC.3
MVGCSAIRPSAVASTIMSPPTACASAPAARRRGSLAFPELGHPAKSAAALIYFYTTTVLFRATNLALYRT